MIDTAFTRYHLSLPGFWIEHEDRDWAGDLHILLRCAANEFNDALIAFDLFKPFTIADVQRNADGVPISEDLVESRRRFLYARAFVYALDAARGFVFAVREFRSLPSATSAACDAFLHQFGYVRDIRNSLQHVEERAQAKGSGKTRLGPIIDLGSLNERQFGVTTGQGQHLEVDITEDYIRSFRSALADIFGWLEWLGLGETPIRRTTEADA
jgi:hypothetical protein